MPPGTAHSGAAQPIWPPAFAGAHPLSREPYGGWVPYEGFQPEKIQTCLSIGRLIHDDDCIKVLAGSGTIVGDEERLMLSGAIEIPARCVVRIVRLEEQRAAYARKRRGSFKTTKLGRPDLFRCRVLYYMGGETRGRR